MSEGFLNSILQAADVILKEISSIEFKQEKIFSEDLLVLTNEVSMVVGITGNLSGHVVFSMSQDTAKKLISKWTKKVYEDIVEEILESGTAEIANMVTGRAAIFFENTGEIVRLSPPAVFIGDNIRIKFGNLKTTKALLNSEIGKIEISLAVKMDG